ncbi:1367_t:CDS:2 [Ambispora gerdemannii]|uniref:1367_t:CDS:1 n=1 Tax=Ambispora gerdemannii TaxID=144530 RepID=A0A9N9CTU0_9GLOM|nr:1367_t:CDS:2 [Ambispora gerdemannii]
MERSPLSGVFFWKNIIEKYDRPNIEITILLEQWKWIQHTNTKVQTMFYDTIVIYYEPTIEQTWKRIQQRNRNEEKSMTIKYVSQIQQQILYDNNTMKKYLSQSTTETETDTTDDETNLKETNSRKQWTTTTTAIRQNPQLNIEKITIDLANELHEPIYQNATEMQDQLGLIYSPNQTITQKMEQIKKALETKEQNQQNIINEYQNQHDYRNDHIRQPIIRDWNAQRWRTKETMYNYLTYPEEAVIEDTKIKLHEQENNDLIEITDE